MILSWGKTNQEGFQSPSWSQRRTKFGLRPVQGSHQWTPPLEGGCWRRHSPWTWRWWRRPRKGETHLACPRSRWQRHRWQTTSQRRRESQRQLKQSCFSSRWDPHSEDTQKDKPPKGETSLQTKLCLWKLGTQVWQGCRTGNNLYQIYQIYHGCHLHSITERVSFEFR